MSQVAIREYDAKKIVFAHLGQKYQGYLVQNTADLKAIPAWQRVIKPDQLFGKRGKLWLVGVKLDAKGLTARVQKYANKNFTIKWVTDKLHTFLVEPFVPHKEEYYLAIKSTRDADIIYFSTEWGVEVEENWSKVTEIQIAPIAGLTSKDLVKVPKKLHDFVSKVLEAYRAYGFAYLEINPFVFDAKWNIHLLDTVAKVDNCENYRQPGRKHIDRVKPFGTQSYPAEEYIAAVDEKTGASLKLTIINPTGRIRLILGGGGASVITMDTLANKWLLDEVANYGELSGNPDEDSNRAYVKTILDLMLANTAKKQYLCLVWWIANFTRIDALCKPFADLIDEYADKLRKKNIHILARRGGINDIKGLAMIAKVCEKNKIPYVIQDADHYLTEIFTHIKL